METQIKRVINVETMASDLKKITLIDGKAKYAIWLYKQDGTETKAYQQFKELSIQAGKVYEAEVKEEPKTFVNDKGKTINFTQRTIMYFYTDAKNAPRKQETPQNTSLTTPQPKVAHNAISSPTSDYSYLLEKTREGFKSIREELDFLKTENKILKEKVEGLVGALDEKQMTAYEFHNGIDDKLESTRAVEVPEDFLK